MAAARAKQRSHCLSLSFARCPDEKPPAHWPPGSASDSPQPLAPHQCPRRGLGALRAAIWEPLALLQRRLTAEALSFTPGKISSVGPNQ